MVQCSVIRVTLQGMSRTVNQWVMMAGNIIHFIIYSKETFFADYPAIKEWHQDKRVQRETGWLV